MCWEDIEIGRASYGAGHVHTVTTSATQLMEANPRRVTHILGAPSTGTVWISDRPDVAVGEGISITAGLPPVILRIEELGSLLTRPWYVIGSAGASLWHADVLLPETREGLAVRRAEYQRVASQPQT